MGWDTVPPKGIINVSMRPCRLYKQFDLQVSGSPLENLHQRSSDFSEPYLMERGLIIAPCPKRTTPAVRVCGCGLGSNGIISLRLVSPYKILAPPLVD